MLMLIRSLHSEEYATIQRAEACSGVRHHYPTVLRPVPWAAGPEGEVFTLSTAVLAQAARLSHVHVHIV